MTDVAAPGGNSLSSTFRPAPAVAAESAEGWPQYQLFATECDHALHGLPYESRM